MDNENTYKNPIRISSVRELPEGVPCSVQLWSDYGKSWANGTFLRLGRQTWVYYDWTREKWTDARRSLVNDQGGGTLRPCGYVREDFDPRMSQKVSDHAEKAINANVALLMDVYKGWHDVDEIAIIDGLRHALGVATLHLESIAQDFLDTPE